MYTKIRLLPLIHSLSSSFFFLSNFQIVKIFVALFQGTVRPRRLKLVIHENNGWMYRVYQNQTAAAYSFLYLFIFLSLRIFFVKDFAGTIAPRILKFGTNVGYDLYCVKENQPPLVYHSLYLSVFLSLQ